MTRLIGLTGPAGCGKSTIAKAMVGAIWVLGVRHRFAGLLKAMLRTLGLTEAQIDGDEKETPCDLLGGKSYRTAAQSLGTEWGRNMIDPQLWLRATMLRVDEDLAVGKLVVIDDVRFDNEAAAIRERGGIVIKLVRDVPERRFPILVPRDSKGRTVVGCPTSVPWSLIEPHRKQAQANHYQTLERLAERGGLSPGELHAVVHDRSWRQMDLDEALQWLHNAVPHVHASEAGVSPHLVDVIVPNQDAPETVARFILDQLKAS